jgi:protocatechuate 3,4-dioxygenase beta subunit
MSHSDDHDDSDRPDDVHDDFGGLTRDLPRLLDRRRALQIVGGVGLAGLLAACGSDSSSGSSAPAATTGGTDTTGTSAGSTSSAPNGGANGGSPPGSSGGPDGAPPDGGSGGETSSSTDAAGGEIPDETAGPYPADGSNGPNVLDVDGIVRSDITTSIGDLSGTADGVPATVQLTIVDASAGSALPGAAVYLWHCTADGAYSIYEVEDQNYLRGVQAADDAGRVTFQTVFPGCYAGRWPHIHFEVYESVDVATAGSQAMKTTQLALAEADCQAVYSDGRYGRSASNLGQLSLATDGVFADGWQEQLATSTGSPSDSYTINLTVRV